MAKAGRKKGLPNLQRTDGGYINQHGVFFTDEQKKALERSVQRSNYQRKKELEKIAQQPHVVGGRVMSKDGRQLQTMNKENDLIIARQHRSLQKFQSMEDYEKFMRKQEAIQDGTYAVDKMRLYKRNFTESLLETYGDEAKDIAMKIRMMNPKDYMRMVASDEVLEIRFVPSDEKVQGRLNQIRAAMQRYGVNIKLKEDWPDEELE